MTQATLRIPGTLKHTSDKQTDVGLQQKAREHADRHPGLHFLTDVLRALHGSSAPLRTPKTFFSTFTPREVMEAFAQRLDLRVKAVKAITGGPPALLRRLSAEALASQIDLLAIDDLPEAERSVRAETDRTLSVPELYLKYLDPLDIAIYLPAQSIWVYESQDEWWKREPTVGTRALMAAELRSTRRHAILTDSEILDLLGDETLERHLPLAVRTELRRLARRAAAEGRPFTDTDLFARSAGSGRDLIDEMVESIPMVQLRGVIAQVATLLGLSEWGASVHPSPSNSVTANDAAAVPVAVTRARPKPAPLAAAPLPGVSLTGAALPNGKGGLTPGPTDLRAAPPAKSPPQMPVAMTDWTPAKKVEFDGPPEPDDDLALVEEASGRI